MSENQVIVPVKLSDGPLGKSKGTLTANTSTPSCQLKVKDTEVLFYNGVDKHILHAVLAEVMKDAR